MNCLWCGNKIQPPRRKYCNHSHQQMSWAKRNPYYIKQLARKHARYDGTHTLNKNLAMIEAAMMLKDENILSA